MIRIVRGLLISGCLGHEEDLEVKRDIRVNTRPWYSPVLPNIASLDGTVVTDGVETLGLFIMAIRP